MGCISDIIELISDFKMRKADSDDDSDDKSTIFIWPTLLSLV